MKKWFFIVFSTTSKWMKNDENEKWFLWTLEYLLRFKNGPLRKHSFSLFGQKYVKIQENLWAWNLQKYKYLPL